MAASPIDILTSWHQIEFFQPYQIEKKKLQVKASLAELEGQKDLLLPWLSPLVQQQLRLNKVKSYTLYIGIFDLSLVGQLCEMKLDHYGANHANPNDIEERLTLEGNSCFVKLTLDSHGVPDLDRISVSSLPWALGCLQQDALKLLTASQYQSKCEELEEIVSRLERHLGHPQSEFDCVTAGWIRQFIIELEEWAGIRLVREHAFILEWKEQTDNKTNAYKAVVPSAPDTSVMSDIKENNKAVVVVPTESKQLEPVADSEEDDDDPVEADMPILNSFYLDDLEKAQYSFTYNQAGKALSQYLSIEQNKAADLYTEAGLSAIKARVSVDKMPHGRWPSSPEHNMSLMQQYAINAAIEELQNGGLLSVNGPPGTGKTTLLRDMVAHNIVERARVLASFSSAKNTLSKDGLPDVRLAGFEMLVASSNNGAVENISRELPLCKSVDQSFLGLSYLTPVANLVNAQKTGKNKFKPMKPEDQCWGNISAVLGKKTNREKFKDSLFFDHPFEKKSDAELNRPDDKNFLNLWRWRALEKDKENEPNFLKAKSHFQLALQKLEQALIQLKQLESIKQRLEAGDLQQEIHFFESACHKISASVDSIVNKKKEAEMFLAQNSKLLKQNQELLNAHQANRPTRFVRIFLEAKYKAYFEQLKMLEQDLLTTKIQQSKQKETLSILQNKEGEERKLAASLDRQLADKVHQLSQLVCDYESLSSAFSNMCMPEAQQNISDPDLQRNAYWQNVEVNRLRSNVFVKAMALHEAWLYEALSNPAFIEQVITLSKQLGVPHKADDPDALWRLFFMIVPVASTTFASVGRMLVGVSEEALGWLFIDEAGQAVPQAAVGAIMRAKRVLVVGDPLQIEPVFTTSPDLVRLLSEQSLGEEAERWSPATLSVQQVADRAHPFGCTLDVMNQEQWIGIPLWVHRRCVEPMFSLSNKIAYNDRMIHGLSSEKIQRKLAFGISNNWIESKGKCIEKQYKNELFDDTYKLICQILGEGGELKDIYVISPFKAVKNELKEAFLSEKNRFCNEFSILKKDYDAWLKNVGTVHTFQGKENEVVIFVLGCDPNNMGGAQWAGSKPNLLNVAVTRAKKQLYVVGDSSVWQGTTYFDQLFACLEGEIGLEKELGWEVGRCTV